MVSDGEQICVLYVKTMKKVFYCANALTNVHPLSVTSCPLQDHGGTGDDPSQLWASSKVYPALVASSS